MLPFTLRTICGCQEVTPTSCIAADVITYVGPNLPCSGIQNNDTLTVALQKLDYSICGQSPFTTTTTTTTTIIPVLLLIEVTKAAIDGLIMTNNLIVGATYKISGVHPTLYNDGTNAGTIIYLQALTTNTLAKEGHGEFYNPKYNKLIAGFGIWSNYSTWAATLLTGNFLTNELITGDGGQTGQLLATLDNNTFIALTGDWSTVTSITGNSSLATASIATIILKTYAIGSNVIWGGYSWTNISGLVGTSTNVLNLGLDWTKDVYSLINYNKVLDIIEYDYINDWISRRYEVQSGNDIIYNFRDKVYMGFIDSAISVFMFGNEFDVVNYIGIGNNLVIHAYNENINFTGTYQDNLTFDIGSYQSIITFGPGSYQDNLTFGPGSSQDYFTFGTGAYQNYLTFGANSHQQDISLSINSFQNNITFGSNSYQNNIVLGSNSSQFGLTFSTNSFQNVLTFIANASQNNLVFGLNSYQSNITFETLSSQNSLIFGVRSFQDTITINSGFGQQKLTFDNSASQQSLIIISLMSDITFATDTNVVGVVYTTATLINQLYPKTIYKRPDGVIKLRYYNNSDVLVIADIID